MENLTNAGPGINKAYRAMRGVLVCMLLTWISSLKLWAALGILIFMVFYIIGLHEAGKDLAGCRKAFMLSLVNIFMAVFSMLPFSILNVPVSLVRYGIEFLIVYLVFSSVCEITDRIGAMDVRKEGKMAWQVNAVCYGVMAGATILGWILYTSSIQMLIAIADVLISLLAKVFYVLFLSKCNQALNP